MNIHASTPTIQHQCKMNKHAKKQSSAIKENIDPCLNINLSLSPICPIESNNFRDMAKETDTPQQRCELLTCSTQNNDNTKVYHPMRMQSCPSHPHKISLSLPKRNVEKTSILIGNLSDSLFSTSENDSIPQGQFGLLNADAEIKAPLMQSEEKSSTSDLHTQRNDLRKFNCPSETQLDAPHDRSLISSDDSSDLEEFYSMIKTPAKSRLLQSGIKLSTDDSQTARKDLPKSNSQSITQVTCKPRDTLPISSDDSSDLEQFYSVMKTPAKSKISFLTSGSKTKNSFIDDSSLSEGSDNDGYFYTNTPLKTPKMRKAILPWREGESSDDELPDLEAQFQSTCTIEDQTDSVFKTPDLRKAKDIVNTRVIKSQTPYKKFGTPLSKSTDNLSEESIFLSSLSADSQSKYVTKFNFYKVELTQKLFTLFNDKIFSNKLPRDMEIEWNKRLLKTAGRCHSKLVKHDNVTYFSASIALSTKVCDSAERVRDTLLHEMCHAAVFIINQRREGHGMFWKNWAQKCTRVFPSIPVPSRCHAYSISTKYSYQCVNCGYTIGRHSKSLDTATKFCGFCHGRFELIHNKKQSKTKSCN